MDRFSAEAATWDEQPDQAQRASVVADGIRAAVPLRSEMTAIEIGGGTGLLSRALADDLGAVTVTDSAPGMVEVATAVLAEPRFALWRVARYDVEHDPLPAERYDLVVSLLALHHMGDVAAVIRNTFALLQPGGWVALADLDHDPEGEFHSRVPDFDGHHGFTRDSVEAWLTAAGFVDVALTTAHREPKTDGSGDGQDFLLFLATGRRPE